MRRSLYIIHCIFPILMMMVACSGIPEDERLIAIKSDQATDTISTDSVNTDTISIDSVGLDSIYMRAVLIEDFTGQGCLNCPNAAEVITNLQSKYGHDKIVAVGIHASELAEYSKGSRIGLRTQEGDDYYNFWKVEVEPSGLINRTGGVCTIDKWPNLVSNMIDKPASVALTLSNIFDEQDRQANIQLIVSVNEKVEGKVQLWLTESDIVARQRMPDNKWNANYVHNHVFRHTVNGLWGDDFKADKGTEQTLNFTASIEEGWQPQNMTVVAFIYDQTGVLQVTEAPLIPQEEDESENKEI